LLQQLSSRSTSLGAQIRCAFQQHCSRLGVIACTRARARSTLALAFAYTARALQHPHARHARSSGADSLRRYPEHQPGFLHHVKLLPTTLSLRARCRSCRELPVSKTAHSRLCAGTRLTERRASPAAHLRAGTLKILSINIVTSAQALAPGQVSGSRARSNLLVASARAAPRSTATGRRWSVAGVNGTLRELSRS